MNYRYYCELKVNDKKTGELVRVVSGVYEFDEDDVKRILRHIFTDLDEVVDGITDILTNWLLSDVDNRYKNENYVFDMDISFLENEYYDEDEEGEED